MYNQLISNNISNINLIGISKEQLSNSVGAWSGVSDVPIVIDSAGNPAWLEWDASNRDLFVLNPYQEIEYKVNMTSTNNYSTDEIYSFIESLALAYVDLQLGDGNSDGAVNILDAVLVVQYALGNIDLTEDQIDNIDLNQDNTIDILDIVSLVALILNS